MRMLLPLVLALGACVPTAARKSARIHHGFDFEVNGGAQLILEGRDETGAATETEVVPHGELDFQWGSEFANETALALQVKVPYNVFFTTFDVFYQLPSPDNELFYGVGAELGIAPAAYAVITQFLTSTIYMSLTPRLVLLPGAELADHVGLNPQLTIGNEGDANVGLFLSYMRVLGRGFDFELDLFTDSDNRDDRNNFLVLGAAVRF